MDPTDTSSDASDASGNTYGEMVMNALSTINDENGVDIDAIYEFIKERYEVPQDFRKRLRNKLKKLVTHSKLEKIENRYKILGGTNQAETVNPDDSTKPEDLPSTSTASKEITDEMIDETLKLVAMAENLEFQAKEAYEEAKRSIELLQENHINLKLSKEIFQLCSKGEKVFLR